MESDEDFFSFMGLPKELVTSNRPLRLRLEPRTEGSATQRGSGAELRSDMHTVVRGEQGVLITAESSNAFSGKHIQRPELIRIADALQKLALELSANAERFAGDRAPGKELPNLIEKLSHFKSALVLN